ncbi:MAG: DUF1287 domain-containing protein [Bacteroidota bacterium]|nr:DUF1287 domain-containing protein [Kiloniellaceae bacterium]
MFATTPDSVEAALRCAGLAACLLLTLPAAAGADAAGTAAERLSAAALARTEVHVTYDPAYVRLAYPGGDVAPDRGVCADVIVRVFRAALGVDLQKLVHEDMAAAFEAYPQLWGLTRPDRNIDHRRVPNLETFFRRQGAALAVSDDAANFRPGDVVAWNLRGNSGSLPHIGIVTDRVGASGRPLVVHNIGAGPKLEDVLFAWPITGHYRTAFEPRGHRP